MFIVPFLLYPHFTAIDCAAWDRGGASVTGLDFKAKEQSFFLCKSFFLIQHREKYQDLFESVRSQARNLFSRFK